MIPALVNHLWQSTLFALGAGLLTLAMRRNGAGVRYGLWFAASVKFLVPFALLTAAAGLGAERLHLSLSPPHELQVLAPVVEPFTPRAAITPAMAPQAGRATLPHATVAPDHATAIRLDPAPILLGVWALGLAVVLLVWGLRWSRIREALRVAKPTRLPAPVPVLSTPLPMEPGVVGLWKPVLIVPDGLAEQLSPAQWNAVLAHELCHIRRRDNLTGALHMLVQALFWFHPLVWWLGARLIAERERACDEAVVRAGADARTYAEGILKVCRLYVRQSLACAAGVSGSNLKTRVETIMNGLAISPLSPLKKALLLAAAAFTFATPVTAGLLSSPEGQKAIARATAVTSSALRVSGRASPVAGPVAGPDETVAAKPIVLSRNATVLAPTLSVGRSDAAPVVLLAQDIPGPAIQPAPAPSAAVAPEAVKPAPAMAAAAAGDLKKQASSFVQSYGGALWNSDAICVRVEGLTPDKAARVKARVEAVAKSVGVVVRSAACRYINVEIRFTTDPGRAVGEVIAEHSGEKTPRPSVGLIRPIQAWYQLAPSDSFGGVESEFHEVVCCKLQLAIVVVDLRRTADKSLELVSDYVAMLALSQPRSVDRCQVLPSVTDLFAGTCPGRTAPDGLTAADVAYLTALYTGDGAVRAVRLPSELSDRMAAILGNPKVAAR